MLKTHTLLCASLYLLTACGSPTPSASVDSSGPSPVTSKPNPMEASATATPPVPAPEVEQNLKSVLENLAPGIRSNAKVAELTRAHAEQIASDPQQTRFKLTAYDPVPPSNIEVLLQNQNLFVSDNLVTTFLSDGDPENLKQRFETHVKNVLGSIPFTDYGVSVVKKGPSWFVSAVLITKIVELEDMPTRFAETGTINLVGEVVREDFLKRRILMTRPDGKVEEIGLSNETNTFNQPLNLDQTGLYSIEVEVLGELGPLPACNFVVAVGVPYPDTEPFATEPETISDIAQARTTLLELINADRQAVGIAPLQLRNDLNQVSQAHSEDMVTNNFVAHNSPTEGIPQEQAYKFGVNDHVAQNIAVSRTLKNSHRELMSSPAHRKTILEAGHTHVGFGIEAGEDGFLYITQNFVDQFLELETLPESVNSGGTLTLKGTAPRDGVVALFLKPVAREGARLQFTPDDHLENVLIDVKAGDAFSQNFTIAKPAGEYFMGIGYSEAPKEGDTSLNFGFENSWEITVR